MTWLPAVDCEGRELLLPLSCGTATRWLQWLLDDGESDPAVISRGLLVDPFAVWWLRYRVPRLRTVDSLFDLSTQLDRRTLLQALGGLVETDVERRPAKTLIRRAAQIATDAAQQTCQVAGSVPDACQSFRVLAVLLQHAETWGDAGSATGLAESPVGDSDWPHNVLRARLHDDSPLGRALYRRIMTVWRSDEGAAGRRLMTLQQRLRRLEQLEQSFAFELEQSKLAALKEFAYGASHEINNPLTNIAARAQLLQRQERLAEEDRQALRVIHQQAMRAFQMIADLSLFAKPPAMHPERIPVEALLRDVIQKVTRDAAVRSPHLEVVMRADRSLGWIDADRTQLIVAVDALCQNALEAIGDRGTVSVVAAAGCDPRGRPELRLRVRDSGPGITADVLPHIFDPFFSGREAGRGLGFGLCKAWRIVTDHGGRIWPDATPRRGCRFTICLPHYVPRA